MVRGTDNYEFNAGFGRKPRGSVTLSSIRVANLDGTEDEDGSTSKEFKAQEDSENEQRSNFPTRKIIIEPVLMLIFMFHMSSFSLSGQYMYYAFGEKYNLSAVLKAEREQRNETSGGGGGSRCTTQGGDNNSTGYDLQQKAQAENAQFNIYMDLVSDIPGFFMLLIYGKISDRLGRKPCLIIPLCGIIFRCLVYIVQQLFHLPIEIILITGLSDALTGGLATLMGAGFAFYADTIPKEKRGRRMAISDVAFGLSFAVSGFAMGYMIQYWGFFWPFLIVLGGHILNMVYIIFFVPESGKKSKTWRNISPRYVIDSFKVLPKKRPNNGRKYLLMFVAAWLTMIFARSARGIDSLYRLNAPFCWTPTMMGTYNSVSSLLMNSVQLFATIFLFKPLGDLGIVILSMVAGTADEFVTGLAVLQTWLLWLAPVVGSLKGVQTPVLRAFLSKLVQPDEQGALFSSLSAISSLVGIGGSAMYNSLYAATLYYYKGTVFFLIAAFLLLSTIIVIFGKITYERDEKKRQEAEEKTVNLPAEDDKAKF